MSTRFNRSMVELLEHYKVIPAVVNRAQLQQVLKTSACKVVLLRHCNLLELAPILQQARQCALYVNIDSIEGVHADVAGLSYLSNTLGIAGILSANPKALVVGKVQGMETVLRIFAADSTGLESALEAFDPAYVDLLDVSPALAIPSIVPPLKSILPVPFIGSGLISSSEQVQAVMDAGAIGVVLAQDEWPGTA
ncbi:MAG: glycerol-3-phosphate responsive antiterminator [Ktedonobacteraceae bacterium]|nr:glycerol-3-phosphate responsive antiterminator [Ktedonobacteraceae bacterium]